MVIIEASYAQHRFFEKLLGAICWQVAEAGKNRKGFIEIERAFFDMAAEQGNSLFGHAFCEHRCGG